MSEKLSHEEISQRFLESRSVDFDAIGTFMAKYGPELVAGDDGLHGVLHGRFNTLACILRADDLRGLFSGLRGVAGLADAVDLPRQ